MQTKTKQYLNTYFKHNGVVLVCELLIVLLLSLICTILVGAKPVWLAPVLTIVAYLLAELRFMMAYITKCVKRDRALQAEAASIAERQAVQEEQDAAETPVSDEYEDESDEEDDFSPFAPEGDAYTDEFLAEDEEQIDDFNVEDAPEATTKEIDLADDDEEIASL